MELMPSCSAKPVLRKRMINPRVALTFQSPATGGTDPPKLTNTIHPFQGNENNPMKNKFVLKPVPTKPVSPSPINNKTNFPLNSTSSDKTIGGYSCNSKAIYMINNVGCNPTPSMETKKPSLITLRSPTAFTKSKIVPVVSDGKESRVIKVITRSNCLNSSNNSTVITVLPAPKDLTSNCNINSDNYSVTTDNSTQIQNFCNSKPSTSSASQTNCTNLMSSNSCELNNQSRFLLLNQQLVSLNDPVQSKRIGGMSFRPLNREEVLNFGEEKTSFLNKFSLSSDSLNSETELEEIFGDSLKYTRPQNLVNRNLRSFPR